MKKFSVIESAYLAGLIDGEGCIAVYHREGYTIRSKQRRKSPYYFQFNITNTNDLVAKKFLELCECGTLTKQITKNKPHHKPRHHFNIRKREDILNLLTQIVGYLMVKKPQAEIMINLINSRLSKSDRAKYTTDEEKMIEDIRFLNKRGLTVVPMFSGKLSSF